MKFSEGLRFRTLALPAGLLAILAVFACALGIERLLSGFRHLEEEEIGRARERARRAISRHFASEQQKVRDWAEWDDAVNWLDGRNPGFSASNLSDSTLSVLGEDLLVYWNERLIRYGGLQRSGRLPGSFERDLRHMVGQGDVPWSGILRCDSGLVVVTVREVTNSDGQPPRHGWLAMAHRIDSRMLSLLSTDLQCAVWIQPDARTGSTDSSARLSSDSTVIGIPLEVENGPEATLWMGMGRPLHRLGLSASRTYFLHFFGATISFVALGLLLLERMVLFRLMRLTRGVEAIREQGVAAPVVRDLRPDEIGRLSWRIDEMVAAMRASQKRMEAALDQAQSANRARVNFLASMTHELRTPLNGVIGLTEYVLKSERDVESREALELSRGAALGLLETINGVLEYARLEKGVVELVVDDADLEATVVDPIKVLGAMAAKKGVALQTELDPRLPRAVRIDAPRLRQILNNLAGNAIKFTEKGRVLVRVNLSEESADLLGGDLPPGDRVGVDIEVADSGVGIPPERLQAIFEPFEQATSQTAIKYGGTGLGLTIARSLVRAMGGEIAVESVLGEGSRFRFSLRMAVVDPRPLVVPLRTRRVVRVRSLLVEPGLQANLERVLERMNLKCESGDPGTGPHPFGSSHLVVLDSRALMENHELAHLAPTSHLLVLADPEHIHDIRFHLLAFRTEILALPAGPGAVAQAIKRLAVPDVRVVVAVAGVVLRGMVAGMVEKSGLVVLEAKSGSEALLHLSDGNCQIAVVDLDDPQWTPFLERTGSAFQVVGLVDDPAERAHPNQVVKPIQAKRLMRAIEAAMEELPDGPDAPCWPNSQSGSSAGEA
jgi:signal transduction histidine kinase